MNRFCCIKCGIPKPLADFPSRGKGQIDHRCKACKNQMKRVGNTPLVQRRAEITDLRQRGLCSCCRCRTVKPLHEFVIHYGHITTLCRACKPKRHPAEYYQHRLEQRIALRSVRDEQKRIEAATRIPVLRHKESNIRGRGRSSKEYISWRAMLKRCYYPRHHNYYRYGARGIRVCNAWRRGKGYGFAAFLHDMGRAPDSTFTLDRTDRYGDYEPTNVRWASKRTQARDHRRRQVA